MNDIDSKIKLLSDFTNSIKQNCASIQSSFINIAYALYYIKNENLFKVEYKSFNEYVKKNCKFNIKTAYNLINVYEKFFSNYYISQGHWMPNDNCKCYLGNNICSINAGSCDQNRLNNICNKIKNFSYSKLIPFLSVVDENTSLDDKKYIINQSLVNTRDGMSNFAKQFKLAKDKWETHNKIIQDPESHKNFKIAFDYVNLVIVNNLYNHFQYNNMLFHHPKLAIIQFYTYNKLLEFIIKIIKKEDIMFECLSTDSNLRKRYKEKIKKLEKKLELSFDERKLYNKEKILIESKNDFHDYFEKRKKSLLKQYAKRDLFLNAISAEIFYIIKFIPIEKKKIEDVVNTYLSSTYPNNIESLKEPTALITFQNITTAKCLFLLLKVENSNSYLINTIAHLKNDTNIFSYYQDIKIKILNALIKNINLLKSKDNL